jgi:23S rRNA maturation-related 3'-5' exoribonuclease YhaM
MDNNEFCTEIGLINNSTIKNIVKEIFDYAPEYFWTCPASSTGKHHPMDERGEKGTIIHVHKVVKIGNDLCTAFKIEGNQRDIVLAALLLHDICKFGYPNNTGSLIMGHGNLVANVAKAAKISENSFYLSDILCLISTHMGRWDVPFKPPSELLPMIVHMADFIASREYISIKME